MKSIVIVLLSVILFCSCSSTGKSTKSKRVSKQIREADCGIGVGPF